MYVALADQQGVPRDQVRGTLQNDILKEFIAQKEWVIPSEPSLDVVTDTIEFAVAETPEFRPASFSGYHPREAGATAAQEAVFTLADGFAYVKDCLARGMDVDVFAPLLSFFFNSHNSSWRRSRSSAPAAASRSGSWTSGTMRRKMSRSG